MIDIKNLVLPDKGFTSTLTTKLIEKVKVDKTAGKIAKVHQSLLDEIEMGFRTCPSFISNAESDVSASYLPKATRLLVDLSTDFEQFSSDNPLVTFSTVYILASTVGKAVDLQLEKKYHPLNSVTELYGFYPVLNSIELSEEELSFLMLAENVSRVTVLCNVAESLMGSEQEKFFSKLSESIGIILSPLDNELGLLDIIYDDSETYYDIIRLVDKNILYIGEDLLPRHLGGYEFNPQEEDLDTWLAKSEMLSIATSKGVDFPLEGLTVELVESFIRQKNMNILEEINPTNPIVFEQHVKKEVPIEKKEEGEEINYKGYEMRMEKLEEVKLRPMSLYDIGQFLSNTSKTIKEVVTNMEVSHYETTLMRGEYQIMKGVKTKGDIVSLLSYNAGDDTDFLSMQMCMGVPSVTLALTTVGFPSTQAFIMAKIINKASRDNGDGKLKAKKDFNVFTKDVVRSLIEYYEGNMEKSTNVIVDNDGLLLDSLALDSSNIDLIKSYIGNMPINTALTMYSNYRLSNKINGLVERSERPSTDVIEEINNTANAMGYYLEMNEEILLNHQEDMTRDVSHTKLTDVSTMNMSPEQEVVEEVKKEIEQDIEDITLQRDNLKAIEQEAIDQKREVDKNVEESTEEEEDMRNKNDKLISMLVSNTKMFEGIVKMQEEMLDKQESHIIMTNKLLEKVQYLEDSNDILVKSNGRLTDELAKGLNPDILTSNKELQKVMAESARDRDMLVEQLYILNENIKELKPKETFTVIDEAKPEAAHTSSEPVLEDGLDIKDALMQNYVFDDNTGSVVDMQSQDDDVVNGVHIKHAFGIISRDNIEDAFYTHKVLGDDNRILASCLYKGVGEEYVDLNAIVKDISGKAWFIYSGGIVTDYCFQKSIPTKEDFIPIWDVSRFPYSGTDSLVNPVNRTMISVYNSHIGIELLQNKDEALLALFDRQEVLPKSLRCGTDIKVEKEVTMVKANKPKTILTDKPKIEVHKEEQKTVKEETNIYEVKFRDDNGEIFKLAHGNFAQGEYAFVSEDEYGLSTPAIYVNGNRLVASVVVKEHGSVKETKTVTESLMEEKQPEEMDVWELNGMIKPTGSPILGNPEQVTNNFNQNQTLGGFGGNVGQPDMNNLFGTAPSYKMYSLKIGELMLGVSTDPNKVDFTVNGLLDQYNMLVNSGQQNIANVIIGTAVYSIRNGQNKLAGNIAMEEYEPVLTIASNNLLNKIGVPENMWDEYLQGYLNFLGGKPTIIANIVG